MVQCMCPRVEPGPRVWGSYALCPVLWKHRYLKFFRIYSVPREEQEISVVVL